MTSGDTYPKIELNRKIEALDGRVGTEITTILVDAEKAMDWRPGDFVRLRRSARDAYTIDRIGPVRAFEELSEQGKAYVLGPPVLS